MLLMSGEPSFSLHSLAPSTRLQMPTSFFTYSYLLSPATSLIGGAGTPAARICLLGSATPTTTSTEGIDLESIKLTELVEFAFSLAPTVKGQEPFLGFPHLQALRLYHATKLADAGHVSQASK